MHDQTRNGPAALYLITWCPCPSSAIVVSRCALMCIGCTIRSRHCGCDSFGVPTHARDAPRGNTGAQSAESCAFRIGTDSSSVSLRQGGCLAVALQRSQDLRKDRIPGSHPGSALVGRPGPGPDRRSLTIFQIPAAPALRPGRPSGPASAPHANTHHRNHTPVRAGLTSHSPHDQDRRARNQTAGSEKMHGRPDIYTMHTFSSSLCHPSFPRPSSPSYTTSTHPTTLRGCKHGRPRVIPGGEATQQYVVPPRPAGRSKPLEARGTIHADDTRRTRVVSGV